MLRSLFVVLIAGLLCSPAAYAQYQQHRTNYQPQRVVPSWSVNLLKDTEHDFGTVARASKHEHTFTFINPTQSDMVLSGVRASCGCATPTIKTPVVKPGETGQIHVRFNTLSFLGQRRAKITVSVSSPSFVELYCDIKGFVRKDIVVNPGQVNFGEYVVGNESKQSIAISYAGRTDWQITDVVSNNSNISGELTETKRQNGLVSYRLDLTLSNKAEPGYLTDQIMLVTNDLNSKEFPISVNGYLKPAIETNAIVDIGEIMQGETLHRKIVLRSADAFAVIDAKCNSEAIKLAPSDKSSKMHILAVEIQPDKEGRISEEIIITTDNAAQKETRVKIIGNVIRSAVVNNE